MPNSEYTIFLSYTKVTVTDSVVDKNHIRQHISSL